MNARLVEIRIENFGSFLGEHTVSFEDGLTLFEGRSGAGKSTIFRAIAFCLGHCPLGAKDLQSDHTKEKFQLVLSLDVDGSRVVVERGKKNALTVDGIPKTDASSELPKLLANILGSPETIEALTYRDQDKAFNFLDLSDGDKKDFISPLVPGMKHVEEELEYAQKQAQYFEGVVKERADALLLVKAKQPEQEKPSQTVEGINAERELLNQQLDDIKAQFKTKKAAVKELKEQLLEAFQKELLVIKAKKWASEEADQIQHVLQGCKEHLKECEANIGTERNAALQVYNQENQAYNAYQLTLSKLGALQNELMKVELQGQKIGVGKCPTCNQVISDPKIQEANAIARQDLKNKIQALEGLPVVPKPIQPTFVPSERLQTQKTNLTKKIEELEGLRANALADQKKFELEKALAVKEVNNQMLAATLEAANDTKNIEVLETHEIQTKKLLLDALCYKLGTIEQYQKWSQECDAAQRALHLAEANQKQWTDYSQMLKSFKAHVFEELLEELSDKTNEILSQLDNTADVLVSFKTIKEQTKGQKEAITPSFLFRGVERPLKTASGGMKLVVRFAISLAIADVVASRTGKNLKWLLLDEALHSLNQEVRRQCLGILEAYSKNRQVLVIDHGADFEAMFSQVIHVENTEGKSRIV